MRIAVIGDLQYSQDESIENIVEDINSIKPDITVLLGDYGDWNKYGSYEAFSAIKTVFSKLNCKNIIPLMGNHDLQYENGLGKFPKGTAAENYKKAFGFYPENQFTDCNGVRIFCINLECQPEGKVFSEYECYISDGSFSRIKEELDKSLDAPVIFITHAPPVGCKLINVPQTHLRASNAYLEQNHNYIRWVELIKTYPNIKMWFNGHYHIGHDHINSLSEINGLTFFTTGSPTSASRDEQYHSRVIDVTDNDIIVRTFNHKSRKMRSKPDYVTKKEIRKGALELFFGTKFDAGCGKVVPGGLKLGKNKRLYAQTYDGYLWEIDLDAQTVFGTLHYSRKYELDDFFCDKDYVWRICGDKAFGHRYDDPMRFMREYDIESCRFVTKDAGSIVNKDASGVFCYNGNPACSIDENTFAVAYNEDNSLYIEILERF